MIRRRAIFAIVFAFLPLGASVQGAETASATLTYAKVDATTYRYFIKLHDTGTTTVGTLWYAWVPGEDFLPTVPSNIISPSGWTFNIINAGLSDGYAIRWQTNTPMAAGTTLKGFSFDSADTPAALAGKSPFFPSTNVGVSFVYEGVAFGDPGFQFTINPVTDPWQNPTQAVDVDDNGVVAPLDALLVINSLNSAGPHSLAAPPTVATLPPPYIDVNGDSSLSALDALVVINDLNASPGPLPPEAMGLAIPQASAVPEPSGRTIALLGLSFFVLGLLRHRQYRGAPTPLFQSP